MSQAPAFRSRWMLDNFEVLLEEYEPMIYHLLNKYHVRDPDNEYYQELAIALWQASRDYRVGEMKFSTYAYSKMNYRLIDLFRKNNRVRELSELLISERQDQLVFTESNYENDPVFLEQVKSQLTDREWLWFEGQILHGKRLVEIAEEYDVKANAVRHWKRRAVVKIRKLLDR